MPSAAKPPKMLTSMRLPPIAFEQVMVPLRERQETIAQLAVRLRCATSGSCHLPTHL